MPLVALSDNEILELDVFIKQMKVILAAPNHDELLKNLKEKKADINKFIDWLEADENNYPELYNLANPLRKAIGQLESDIEGEIIPNVPEITKLLGALDNAKRAEIKPFGAFKDKIDKFVLDISTKKNMSGVLSEDELKSLREELAEVRKAIDGNSEKKEECDFFESVIDRMDPKKISETKSESETKKEIEDQSILKIMIELSKPSLNPTLIEARVNILKSFGFERCQEVLQKYTVDNYFRPDVQPESFAVYSTLINMRLFDEDIKRLNISQNRSKESYFQLSRDMISKYRQTDYHKEVEMPEKYHKATEEALKNMESVIAELEKYLIKSKKGQDILKQIKDNFEKMKNCIEKLDIKTLVDLNTENNVLFKSCTDIIMKNIGKKSDRESLMQWLQKSNPAGRVDASKKTIKHALNLFLTREAFQAQIIDPAKKYIELKAAQKKDVHSLSESLGNIQSKSEALSSNRELPPPPARHSIGSEMHLLSPQAQEAAHGAPERKEVEITNSTKALAQAIRDVPVTGPIVIFRQEQPIRLTHKPTVNPEDRNVIDKMAETIKALNEKAIAAGIAQPTFTIKGYPAEVSMRLLEKLETEGIKVKLSEKVKKDVEEKAKDSKWPHADAYAKYRAKQEETRPEVGKPQEPSPRGPV